MIIKNGLVFNAEGRFEEKEVYVEDEKLKYLRQVKER